MAYENVLSILRKMKIYFVYLVNLFVSNRSLEYIGL